MTTPKFDHLTIQFGQLRYNPAINARGETRTDIGQLAETIDKEGLLQPLLVRPAGKFYEPAEGGRRFFAIEHLVKAKRNGWTAKSAIRVQSRKMTDAEAIEASLATHITRMDLTPAEEAVAFNKLAKAGKSADDIAGIFAVPQRFVLQRLAIGTLPATILKALKAGEINSKAAEAFTLTKDAKLQLKVFNELTKARHMLHGDVIRTQLIGKAERADSRAARYVGEKAYLAAGGSIAADLFGDMKYFEDGKLLGKLFEDELKREEKALLAEGWSFVIIAREHIHDYHPWKRLEPKDIARPAAKQRVSAIDAEIQLCQKKIKTIRETVSEERGDLNRRMAELKSERAGIRIADYSPDQKKASGVVIIIGYNAVETCYGMVKPQAGKKAAKANKGAAAKTSKANSASGTSPSMEAAEPEEPDFSGALKADLAFEMGGALQMAIAGKPQAAHYSLIACMIFNACEQFAHGPIAVKVSAYGGSEIKAHIEFEKLLTAALKPFEKILDKEEDPFEAIVTALELLEHAELMKLQALLIANGVSIDMGFMGDADMRALIKRMDPDVGKYWTPDKAFFDRLKKPDLIEALEEAQAVNIPRSGTKGALVTLAVAELPAKGWLPKPMRAPNYAGPGSNAWADAAGARVADAVAGEALAPAASERKCRQCGCSQDHACIRVMEGTSIHETCHWAEEDLCSFCAEVMPAAQQAAE